MWWPRKSFIFDALVYRCRLFQLPSKAAKAQALPKIHRDVSYNQLWHHICCCFLWVPHLGVQCSQKTPIPHSPLSFFSISWISRFWHYPASRTSLGNSQKKKKWTKHLHPSNPVQQLLVLGTHKWLQNSMRTISLSRLQTVTRWLRQTNTTKSKFNHTRYLFQLSRHIDHSNSSTSNNP